MRCVRFVLLFVMFSSCFGAAALEDKGVSEGAEYAGAPVLMRMLPKLRRQVSGPVDFWSESQVLNRGFLEKIFGAGVPFELDITDERLLKVQGTYASEIYEGCRLPGPGHDGKTLLNVRIARSNSPLVLGSVNADEESLSISVLPLEKVFFTEDGKELREPEETSTKHPGKEFVRVVYERRDGGVALDGKADDAEISWRLNVEKRPDSTLKVPNVEIIWHTNHNFLRGFQNGLMLSFNAGWAKPFIFATQIEESVAGSEIYSLTFGPSEERVCSESKDFILGVMVGINLLVNQ
jgi:hypothetical protein